MKKIFIFAIFLLLVSGFTFFGPQTAYADDPTTFDISFTLGGYNWNNTNKFNNVNNTLTEDYANFTSDSTFVQVYANVTTNVSSSRLACKWQNESGDVISETISLNLYKYNEDAKKLILVGDSKYILTVSDKESNAKQQRVVIFKITDNNKTCKMFMTPSSIETTLSNTSEPIEFKAVMPIATKHSINWFMKVSNSNSYNLVQSSSANYTFNPEDYINNKNGYGTYNLMAVATDSKDNAYYSQTITFKAYPESADSATTYDIVSVKAKNTRANVEAKTYSLSSTVGLDPTRILWYVNDVRVCSGETMTYEPDTIDEYKVSVKYQYSTTNIKELADLTVKPLPTNIYVYVLCGVAGLLVITGIFAVSIIIINKKRDVVW